MDAQALPRRERERLRQREEMLLTALELFSKKGYRNVSMHEIAEKAEFAIGTLYKFFKNKEELYKALILENVRVFHGVLMRAITEPDEEMEKLWNFVRIKGEFFRANASMIRLYFAETQGANVSVLAEVHSEIRARHSEFLQTLASVFESGIRRKRFRKIADPFYLAVALDSFSNSLLLLWLEAPERHRYPEDPDVILKILFKGLVA